MPDQRLTLIEAACPGLPAFAAGPARRGSLAVRTKLPLRTAIILYEEAIQQLIGGRGPLYGIHSTVQHGARLGSVPRTGWGWPEPAVSGDPRGPIEASINAATARRGHARDSTGRKGHCRRSCYFHTVSLHAVPCKMQEIHADPVVFRFNVHGDARGKTTDCRS